jgi:hypothetical protein
MTIFILFLALESFRLFERDRALAGALLLGLGITIKILPIVFLPYLLYRAHFKEFLWVCFFCLALLLLPFLFLENEFYFTLLQSRWELINPSNKIHVVDLDERSFHSLTSFLAALLTDIRMDHHALETKRNLATLSVEQLEMVINVVRLCFVLLMLYFLRTFPFTRAKDKVQKFYELSYLCYVIPLIFPHQQHYAFFFVAPAIYYLAYFYFYSVGTAENPYPILKWLFWILTPIIFFTLSADFLLGEFREYYNHFKTLTYGVLLILPLLILAQPHKLKI